MLWNQCNLQWVILLLQPLFSSGIFVLSLMTSSHHTNNDSYGDSRGLSGAKSWSGESTQLVWYLSINRFYNAVLFSISIYISCIENLLWIMEARSVRTKLWNIVRGCEGWKAVPFWVTITPLKVSKDVIHSKSFKHRQTFRILARVNNVVFLVVAATHSLSHALCAYCLATRSEINFIYHELGHQTTAREVSSSGRLL